MSSLVYLVMCELRTAGAIGEFSGAYLEIMADSDQSAIDAAIEWAHASGFEPRSVALASAALLSKENQDALGWVCQGFTAMQVQP